MVSTPPEVDELLSRQTPAVRHLAHEILRHLHDDEAKVYATEIKGDIRHTYTTPHHPFSQLSLRKDCVLLRLRVGRGSVDDPDFVWSKDRPDKGDVRLYPGHPIPVKVIGWIARAKHFTRSK